MKSTYIVLGGTFDPVHFGHLKSAQELAQSLGYDCIHLMPCGDAYHKDHVITAASDRLAMLQLAVQDLNNGGSPSILQVDDRETRRQGATYTVDTLRELRQELGSDAHLSWVMGTDAAQNLHKWNNWQQLFQLANIIVVARNGEAFKPTEPWPAKLIEDTELFKNQANGAYTTISLTPLDISSSQIRLDLNKQKSVESHVPQVVLNYVEQHGLYQGNH